MTVKSISASLRYQTRDSGKRRALQLDYWLLGSAVALLLLGLVMVGSASISIAEKQHGDAFYYLWRQAAYVLAGIVAAWLSLYIKISTWEKINPKLLIFGLVLLLAVIVLGREVNGSSRWLSLGFVNLQPSELIKLFLVMFLAGYLVRRGDEVRETIKGFLKPIILVSFIAILLLLEPDFGATAVVALTTFGMLFIGGMRLKQFGVVLGLISIAFSIIAVAAPYRMERLKSFLNPWADPYDSGFQLVQALIAFGRGEWFGVGLGGSIQKLFYLPEAHTDFLFAVMSEELGLFAILCVIVLYTIIVYRAFVIGGLAYKAGQLFSAYLCFGIGILIGIQAFTNIGVNMGVLPTKGLTLPLMSYGGSSVVVTCIACAVLARVYHESRPLQATYAKGGAY